MGFGGGGESSTGVSAHLHTNSIGDGGNTNYLVVYGETGAPGYSGIQIK